MLCTPLKIFLILLTIQLSLHFLIIGKLNKAVFRAFSSFTILFLLCRYNYLKIANIFLFLCVIDLLFDIIVLIGMKLDLVKASSPKAFKLLLIRRYL
jgi:hypothetical protein